MVKGEQVKREGDGGREREKERREMERNNQILSARIWI